MIGSDGLAATGDAEGEGILAQYLDGMDDCGSITVVGSGTRHVDGGNGVKKTGEDRGGHAAHACVVDQLAPARVHQPVGDVHGFTHRLKDGCDLFEAGTDGTVEFANLEKMITLGDVLGKFRPA